MGKSTITVRVDDRLRMMSTLLALTTWPEQEQMFHPHGTHAHAHRLREALAHVEEHAAAITMQEMLESGLPLDTVFSYVNVLSWPGIRARAGELPTWAPENWSTQMRDFMHANHVTDLWGRDKAAWADAEQQAIRALEKGDPLDMLTRVFGPQADSLHFQPNLSYPTEQAIGFRSDKTLIAVVPPPVAWGTNPPWPYDDNPADPYREAFSAYARVLLGEMIEARPEMSDLIHKNRLPVPNTFLARHPDVVDQFSTVLVSGLTAIALEEVHGEVEAKSYVVMTHKAHGFQALPAVIDVLRHYLSEQASGKFASFAEYLPSFFNSLRIADKLKKM